MSNHHSYKQRFLDEQAVSEYLSLYSRPNSFDAIIWNLERDALRRIIEHYIPSPSKAKLLDFACGTGRILSYLEDQFESSVGVDISPEMAKVARKRVKRSQIIVGDIMSNPDLVPGPFDVITAFRFFLNAEVSLRLQALQALHRRLSVSGVLIANVHGHSPSLRSVTIRLRRMLRPGVVCNEMTYGQFREIAERAGFLIIDRVGLALLTPRTCSFLGPRLSRMVENWGYRSGVTKWIGSNQIYVLKRR